MRSGLGVGTRGDGRGMRRSALDSDKWGRWRPLVVVGGADGGPGQRRWGGVGGTACMGSPYVSHMVESRSMVNGPSPGPAPAAQARDSNSRFTRSSWRTWPHRKLRRKVPRVDGALTAQPMAPVVPPVRNTSASSMQSPPAPRPPGSASCLPCSPAPAHLRGQRGCRRLHAGLGAGLGSPGGAARHWPPAGCRRMRYGCGRDGCVLAPSCRFRTLTRRPPSVDSGLGGGFRAGVPIDSNTGCMLRFWQLRMEAHRCP